MESKLKVKKGEGERERKCMNEPRIAKLSTDILQVVVAHIVNAEDKAVLVVGDGITDVGK